ncbi:fasciclin domain-containing protein [Mucilaginibacter paludis]|uniref:Beta-Ig-H3/fasciclin n=1 Tax=Mucilaginibacter paludis DSM 18603 TaxID=714943 RepID=H1Y9K5_9SPHI|nr:fasciclin domain-containing protein [Mucilaginibacter paludis]EHQ30507.1 beta-Ig-H3/fasciclin [Mucilaginibacter paludis DSM 18603]
MKKNILIAVLCLSTFYANAQTATTQAAARTPDTNKNDTPKHVKIRVIGGGQMSSADDVVQNIAKSKEHTTFTNSIAVCGLAETLKSRGPLTIFAPTNDAFNKLSPGMLDTLLKPQHNAELTRLLTYHVIPGKLTSKDIARQINSNNGEATFTTLSGSKLKAKINGDRNIVLIDEGGNESVISQFDIEQNNGIIDVVTGLLIPKNK